MMIGYATFMVMQCAMGFSGFSLHRKDYSVSPANRKSGALPCWEGNVHCSGECQCVWASIAIRHLLSTKKNSFNVNANGGP